MATDDEYVMFLFLEAAPYRSSVLPDVFPNSKEEVVSVLL
jgi:hypothetical protein